MADVVVSSTPSGESGLGFGDLFGSTLSLFKSKLGIFLGLAFVGAGVVFLSEFIPVLLMSRRISNFYTLMWILYGIYLARVLINYVLYGTTMNQSFAAYSNSARSLMESVLGTVSLTLRSIMLTLRIFWYCRIWLVVVILLGYVVVVTLLSAGTGLAYTGDYFVKSFGSVVSVQTNPGVNLVDVVLAQSGSGFLDVKEYETVIAVNNDYSFRAMMLTWVNMSLSALGLAIIIIFLIRAVYAVMAYPLLMADPSLTSRQALQQSIAITKGHWLLIVGNEILLFIVTFVVLLVVALIANFLGVAGSVLNLLAASIIGTFDMIFLMVFAQELKKNLPASASMEVKQP